MIVKPTIQENIEAILIIAGVFGVFAFLFLYLFPLAYFSKFKAWYLEKKHIPELDRKMKVRLFLFSYLISATIALLIGSIVYLVISQFWESLLNP